MKSGISRNIGCFATSSAVSFSGGGTSGISLLMIERAFFLDMKRHHDREDGVAVLDRGHAPGRIALAVAQSLDLVDDRNLRIARQDEITMQRMRQAALDGAACRHHRLADHLPAEHPLPARLRAGTAKQVHLERFDIENGNQVDQAFGHRCAFNFGHSGAWAEPRATRNLEIPGSREDACPGMTSRNPCFASLFRPAILR